MIEQDSHILVVSLNVNIYEQFSLYNNIKEIKFLFDREKRSFKKELCDFFTMKRNSFFGD